VGPWRGVLLMIGIGLTAALIVWLFLIFAFSSGIS
jgi:hypothetical protein